MLDCLEIQLVDVIVASTSDKSRFQVYTSVL